MSEIKVNSQYRLVDNKPLDAKLTPVNLPADLNAIPRAQRYEGMVVRVLNWNGKNQPMDYTLKGGTANANWVPKDAVIDCGEF